MHSVEERIVSIFDGVQVQIGQQPFHDFLCLCVRLSRYGFIDNFDFFQKRFLGDQQKPCAGSS